jgi:hypothetical protein
MYTFDLNKMPGQGDSFPSDRQAIYESVRVELSILIGYLENRLGLKDDETQSLKDFIQANLRKAVFEEPTPRE